MLSSVWLPCGLMLAAEVLLVAAKYCTQRTPGGKCCEFPFVYESHSYTTCAVGGLSEKPWCSTTPNFDRDGQWDHCQGITCYICYSTESLSDCESRQDIQTCPHYSDRCMQFSDELNSTTTFLRKCAVEEECSAKQCQGKNRVRCDLSCCMNNLCNAGSEWFSKSLVTLVCLLTGWLIK